MQIDFAARVPPTLREDLQGKNFLGGQLSALGQQVFSAVNPASGQKLAPDFRDASPAEIEQALSRAEAAFEDCRQEPAEKIAIFLENIAEEILQLGDTLLHRGRAERALPEPRLAGERARTVNQIKMFAAVVREL